MGVEFSDAERRILHIVQTDLPDSLTPYADIACQAGTDVTEQMVITFLCSLKREGIIRRFGASIKHQRAGWGSNAMVAWVVRGKDIEKLGREAAKCPNVSHCYYRPSSVPDWPYELYTMVHGHSDEECFYVVDLLCGTLGQKNYLVLSSKQELKKISPTYF